MYSEVKMKVKANEVLEQSGFSVQAPDTRSVLATSARRNME